MQTTYDKLDFDVGTGPLVADRRIMETGRVALATYACQEHFQRERQMFGKVWLNIAEAAEIPQPGDWIVREVKIRSASVIVVRGQGSIRAFHNLCSHRGRKLVNADSGSGRFFSCPAHGWSYDLDGRLVNVPEGAGFALDPQQSGLTPIRCDEWEGLVFINFDAGGHQSLTDYLGPVTQRVKNFPFGSYPYAARWTMDIEANWKLGIEAQCESYHIRVLHARTVSTMLVSKSNPFSHPLAAQALGAHQMQSHSRNPDFQLSPEKLVQTFSFLGGRRRSVAMDRASATQTFVAHPDVNRTGSDLWDNDQYVIYPNLIFHVAPGGWRLRRFWPITPEKTLFEAIYRFETPASLREIFAMQSGLALGRDTLIEDNVALGQQQQVLASGGKTFAQFGDQEIVCKHLAAVGKTVTSNLAA